MSQNNSAVEDGEEKLTKEDYIARYARALDEIEKALEPFREHKRDLKRSFIENNWLSQEEMSMVLRAYRMLKGDLDLDMVQHFWLYSIWPID